jgi:hypothetical protein
MVRQRLKCAIQTQVILYWNTDKLYWSGTDWHQHWLSESIWPGWQINLAISPLFRFTANTHSTIQHPSRHLPQTRHKIEAIRIPSPEFCAKLFTHKNLKIKPYSMHSHCSDIPMLLLSRLQNWSKHESDTCTALGSKPTSSKAITRKDWVDKMPCQKP